MMMMRAAKHAMFWFQPPAPSNMRRNEQKVTLHDDYLSGARYYIRLHLRAQLF